MKAFFRSKSKCELSVIGFRQAFSRWCFVLPRLHRNTVRAKRRTPTNKHGTTMAPGRPLEVLFLSDSKWHSWTFFSSPLWRVCSWDEWASNILVWNTVGQHTLLRTRHYERGPCPLATSPAAVWFDSHTSNNSDWVSKSQAYQKSTQFFLECTVDCSTTDLNFLYFVNYWIDFHLEFLTYMKTDSTI